MATGAQRLAEAEKAVGRPLTPDERKEILISAFTENLQQIGDYQYVVPTEILRPLKDRTLYCLFYATRHEIGLQAFRECQTKALDAQAATRAALKVQQEAAGTGQQEMFTSLHDMGPNEAAALRNEAKRAAEAAVLDLTPKAPDHILYKKLWPIVLTQACRAPHRREHHLRRPQQEGASLSFPIGSRGSACRRITTACSGRNNQLSAAAAR